MCFKYQDKQCVVNNRPVSLRSIVSTVAEKCIYNCIYPLIGEQLHRPQHWFTEGRSTAIQLVECIIHLADSIDDCAQVDFIFSDFSKAFDTVSHPLLLGKLNDSGFNGKLLSYGSNITCLIDINVF